tara:strand:- start:230 stop:418 length:189 start_codon:yes stop_codon:yes gene_type:complete
MKKLFLVFSTLIATSSIAGTTYQSIGNTTFGSDGTTYQSIGNSVFGSDGTTCTSIGSTVFCN